MIKKGLPLIIAHVLAATWQVQLLLTEL